MAKRAAKNNRKGSPKNRPSGNRRRKSGKRPAEKRGGDRHRADRRSAEKRGAVTVEGILRKNRRGFGFVVVEGGEDVFIAAGNMNRAMAGDLVLAEVKSARRGSTKGRQQGPEGTVVKILEKAHEPLVCRFEKISDYGFAVPVDKARREDIYIDRQYTKGADDGDLILVEIIRRPSASHCAEGAVQEIAAQNGERGADIKALVLQKGVPTVFSEEALEEAENAAMRGVLAEDIAGRLDLRDETVFTIDGADSKDFDDAVSCKKTEGGHYILGVHIADVSHYVPMGSALDETARMRGNSIYLPDQVIPMLPPALSNDLCSLRAGEDRLTLSLIMEIDQTGKVIQHAFAESVIRSCERLVYEDVSDLLEKSVPALSGRYHSILPDLLVMRELYEILQSAAEARGAMDFDLTESALTLDENGVCVDVKAAERRTANRIIEAFMIRANETVAEHFCRQKAPFLYRVHEDPDPDDMQALDGFLAGFGLGTGSGGRKVTPRALTDLLERVKDEPYGPAVSAAVLRSMQKAYYDPACLGHFGLALSYYTHFTSPIRRYCDLFIHRVIKASLAGALEAQKERFSALTQDAALQASRCERTALELERDAEKMKKAEYMAAHIGEEFTGTVSGVTSFGLYAELENTVEGLISIAGIEDDYYTYDEVKRRLVGERYRRVYQLGDKVRVRVINAVPYDREIDFALVR